MILITFCSQVPTTPNRKTGTALDQGRGRSSIIRAKITTKTAIVAGPAQALATCTTIGWPEGR